MPLVVDASSHFLSRPLDVARCGMVYAGAQKNAGPAGVTMVIARRDLIGHALPICPSAFDYANVAAEHSRYNTPPTFAIYIAGLVFAGQGQRRRGRHGSRQQGQGRPAVRLPGQHQLLPQSDPRAVRSRMNVPFVLRDDSLNDAFLQGAEAAGLTQLKGHRAWAACAPPSTTPCRWPRCRTWSPT